MSVARLDAKCVDVIGRHYVQYAPERLESVVTAPAAWDALWESAVRTHDLLLPPAGSPLRGHGTSRQRARKEVADEEEAGEGEDARSGAGHLDAVTAAAEVDPRPLLRHRLRPLVPTDGEESGVELDLSSVREVVPQLAEHVVGVCPELTHIRMSGVGDEALAVLIRGLSALRSLTIESAIQLTDAGLDTFFLDADFAGRLRTLHLNRYTKISPSSLQRLVEACSNLQELTLTHFGWRTMRDADLAHTVAHAPLHTTLRSLWLNDCESLSDAALSKVVDECTALEELRIGMGIEITGECFLRFSPHNAGGRLRRLDFNNCPLPRSTFFHIASVCTSLQVLGLANSPTPIDKEQLSFLLKNCPHLTTLSATVSPSGALQCFGEQMNRIVSLYLVALHIDPTTGRAAEAVFEDDDIKSLLTGCLHLESLTLNKVTDNALPLIARALASLRKLSLTIDPDRSTDTALTALDDQQPVCRNLDFLRLSCSSLNARQLHWLLSRLASQEDAALPGQHGGLTEIQLSNGPSIDDEAVEAISIYCASSLQVLSLYGVPNITDRALEVLTRCYLLSQLSIKKCPKLTAPALARLVRARRDSLRQVFFPLGPAFRAEALALAKECPRLRMHALAARSK